MGPKNMKVAYTIPLGDVAEGSDGLGSHQSTPLVKDGFSVPNNLNYDELAQKIVIPGNLIELIKKNKNAFLTLKIVEIIGEDEPYQLDSETIYFITNLLNEMNLIKIRNKVLISALPQRI